MQPYFIETTIGLTLLAEREDAARTFAQAYLGAALSSYAADAAYEAAADAQPGVRFVANHILDAGTAAPLVACDVETDGVTFDEPPTSFICLPCFDDESDSLNETYTAQDLDHYGIQIRHCERCHLPLALPSA